MGFERVRGERKDNRLAVGSPGLGEDGPASNKLAGDIKTVGNSTLVMKMPGDGQDKRIQSLRSVDRRGTLC